MSARASVDVVIPVLNEAHVLEGSVETLRSFLGEHLPHRWRVVIVENGSTDGTGRIASGLAARYPDVAAFNLAQRGRGRALRQAWLASDADVVCYMDVDLSTELSFLVPLVGAIAGEGYDIAAGSRLLPGSKVRRSFKRELISHAYNWFLRRALGVRFSDAQCGFKALSRAAVKRIVPQVQDDSWFFDTELLVLAERQGLRIKDIAVVWNEDDDSRVKIIPTAWDDIKGVLRLRRKLGRAGGGRG